jgi:hypothetical protein
MSETSSRPERVVSEKREEKESVSQQILGLVLKDGTELFHTPEGEPFLTIAVNGHFETRPIGGDRRDFKDFLGKLYYDSSNAVASETTINEAISVLVGKAKFDAPEHQVFVRIAEHEGCINVDLADECWRAVKISREGWEVVATTPVKFRRPRGMLALPVPVPDGSVNVMRPFLNLGTEDQWILVVGWLIGCLKPSGPYPILAVGGQHGSAKTTLTKLLKRSIDPVVAPSRSAPKNEHELAISSKNALLLTFDNLSKVYPWFSDALCRLATGSGFSTRAFFTDDSERLFESSRPVIINSIHLDITRPDLLDRAIILTLPTIESNRRLPEHSLRAGVEAVLPEFLGALFTAVSVGLRRLPEVELSELPRMADFAKFVTAAEPGLGWTPGTFVAAYERNRAITNELALEASVIAQPIEQLIARGPWEGTATELLRDLTDPIRVNGEPSVDDWPKNPQKLSEEFNRIAPNLRATGINIESPQTPGSGSRKLIRISRRTAA